MSAVNPERQRMLDYLRRYHLVPENIKVDDWDEDGFIALNPITGEWSKSRIPWPEGFNFDWFVKLYEVADIADYRHAGLRVPAHMLD